MTTKRWCLACKAEHEHVDNQCVSCRYKRYTAFRDQNVRAQTLELLRRVERLEIREGISHSIPPLDMPDE
jgi:hypothetical protein